VVVYKKVIPKAIYMKITPKPTKEAIQKLIIVLSSPWKGLPGDAPPAVL
jgi:hypothetical protein